METIGKYRIEERIGEGGYGVVYKAFDPYIKRYVAIKACGVSDPEVRSRFFSEAEIAGRLDHPNVVRIFDFGLEGDLPFLVQELLEGEDLERKMRRDDFLSYPEKLFYLIQIARGLEYAHGKGIVHRDIKPSNVQILEDGTAKIMDFGIATLLERESRLTQEGITVGTAAYLAPEQIRGEAVDRRTDIFSYGALAYELVTGEQPFVSRNLSNTLFRILNEQPRPVSAASPGCPSELAQAIHRCLAKDPALRFADCGGLLHVLETLRERGRPPRRPGAPPATVATPRSELATRQIPLRPREQRQRPRGAGDLSLHTHRASQQDRRSRTGGGRLALWLLVLALIAAGGWWATRHQELVAATLANALDRGSRLATRISERASETSPQPSGPGGQPAPETTTRTADATGRPAAHEPATQTPATQTPDTQPPASQPGATPSNAATSEEALAGPDAATPSETPSREAAEPQTAAAKPAPPPPPAPAVLTVPAAWHSEIRVAIDGGSPSHLSRQLSRELPPGEHTLAFSLDLPRYRASQRVTVDLATGESRQVRSPLPRAGGLTVQASLGAPQAIVQLDDAVLGRSPVREGEVRPGRYRLSLQALGTPGVPAQQTLVEVRPGEETIVTFDVTGQKELLVRKRPLTE